MWHMCWSMNKSSLLSIQAALFLLKGNRPIWKIRCQSQACTCPWSSLSLGAHHWIWTLVPFSSPPPCSNRLLWKPEGLFPDRQAQESPVSSCARFWEDCTLASSLTAAWVSPPRRGKGQDSSCACHPSYTSSTPTMAKITPAYTQKHQVRRFYTEPEAYGHDLQPPLRLRVICFRRSRLLDRLLNWSPAAE